MSMFGIAVTKILNGFCIVQRYSKIRQMQKKREKFYEINMQTPVRTSRHRLACARRVSSPPSIPKSCFSIFPFKRVCACFSFPFFFNRSNPILSYFSFTSLFLNKSYYYIFFILFLLIEVLLLKKESLKVIVLRKAIEGNSYCRNCFSGTIVIRKLYVFYIIYIIITECWEKWKILHFTLTK